MHKITIEAPEQDICYEIWKLKTYPSIDQENFY
jgi:hypothetical protein